MLGAPSAQIHSSEVVMEVLTDYRSHLQIDVECMRTSLRTFTIST